MFTSSEFSGTEKRSLCNFSRFPSSIQTEHKDQMGHDVKAAASRVYSLEMETSGKEV
jgi:hypothetical protein